MDTTCNLWISSKDNDLCEKAKLFLFMNKVVSNVIENTTVLVDKTNEITYEKGCKITFKCDPKTMKDEIFDKLKKRVNIDCAYVSIHSFYNGCIYDLYRESACPGTCKKIITD